jgi:hypothetical protein
MLDELQLSFKKEWTTHQPVLIKTFLMTVDTKGPILEIGAGLFSTPLLHWLCKLYGRRLFTLESNYEFYAWARKFTAPGHTIRQVNSVDEYDYNNRRWSIVFIDHDFPESSRAQDAIKLKNNADYIILHDYSDRRNYGYQLIKPEFKYIYIYKQAFPWTAVISNVKELKEYETN